MTNIYQYYLGFWKYLQIFVMVLNAKINVKFQNAVNVKF